MEDEIHEDIELLDGSGETVELDAGDEVEEGGALLPGQLLLTGKVPGPVSVQ